MGHRYLTVLLSSGLLLTATPLQAQRIEGRLVAREDGRPIARAFVVLRDSTAAEAGRALTGEDGRFQLDAPRSGTYRLQTAIIGYRSWTSPPVVLSAADTTEYRIELELRPVTLEPVVVEGNRECRIGADSGRAIAGVWDEARKALAAVSWTQQAESLWYQVIRYDRRLDAENLRPLGGRIARFSGYALGSPFGSQPAEQLAEHGFIRQLSEGVWQHLGPDADVLLSAEFANDHCFYLTPHHEDTALLGLGFEPAPHHQLPDIDGVLWLNRASAELRFLEFRYRNLPWPVTSRHLGGRVEFEQLTTGSWIVSHWQLRMPELAFHTRTNNWTRLGTATIASLHETGGWVIQLRNRTRSLLVQGAASPGDSVTAAADETVVSQPLGVVRGIVGDLAAGEPVARAAVFLVADDGVRALQMTSAQGWFELQAPSDGSYRLQIHHGGYRSVASQALVLTAGRIVDVHINLRPNWVPSDSALEGESGGTLDTLGTTPAGPIGGARYSFTHDEIVELSVHSVVELLSLLPGARRLIEDGGESVALNRRYCRPQSFIDGYVAAPGLLSTIPLEWVEAVEVFPDVAGIPALLTEFTGPPSECGTVLVWTAASWTP